MNNRIYFKSITFFFILMILSGIFAFAQTAKLPEPRQQKLLNGLKLLVWNEPSAQKITIKLRIHSGAAFDPKDKMGVMALLGDILFPSEQSKAFFTEDLEGSLDISTNYDYIQITATGKSDEVLAMIQTIATSDVNPQITRENFKLVRDARLKKVQELEKKPSYIADRAVAKRLFGDFPYGRSAEGTSESLAKLDYADILFAKERFLASDNATLAIIGNIKPDYAYRVSRQLFGAWTKSDKKIPATFRQPDEPDQTPLRLESPVDFIEGIRFAFRGLARNDKDFFAAQIFTKILKNRLIETIPPTHKEGFFIRQHSSLLSGFIVFGFTRSMIPTGNSNETIPESKEPKSLKEAMTQPVTENEYNKAKIELLSEIDKYPFSEIWLDVDTFKLNSVKDDLSKAFNISIDNVQKISENLTRNPMVSVLLYPPMPKVKAKN